MNKTSMGWNCDCGKRIELVFYEFEPDIRYKVWHDGREIVDDTFVRQFDKIESSVFCEAVLRVIDVELNKYVGFLAGCGYKSCPEVKTW